MDQPVDQPVSSSQTAPRTALGELIDYAGMYPPESLSLEDAVTRYVRHRGGSHAWMLGVFLCPSSQLPDLEWMLGGERVPVGAVIDQAMGDAVEAIATSGLQIVQIETRDLSISEHFDHIAPATALWLEAHTKHVLDLASDLPGRRIGVKVRCGGSLPEDFPLPASLAEAMHSTFVCGLPLKATAGLHHPWRHFWPDIGVWRHGFLNLVGAAASLVLDGDRDEATRMLEANDGHLDRNGLRIDDRKFNIADLRSARVFLRSYGSCSFDEPVHDLQAMGELW